LRYQIFALHVHYH